MTPRRPPPAAAQPGTLVEIGILARPHGLAGEMCLNYYAQSLQWLNGPLWLRAGGDGPARPIRATHVRISRGRALIRLEGVEDRNAAEQLRGFTVLMPEDVLPQSDADSPYLHDLMGLAVLSHASGEPIGTLDHVYFIGGQELWAIETPDGKEILFPAVPDFVDAMDLENGSIRISPPPGLIELYAAKASR